MQNDALVGIGTCQHCPTEGQHIGEGKQAHNNRGHGVGDDFTPGFTLIRISNSHNTASSLRILQAGLFQAAAAR